jgi:hypothetical protein
VILIPRLKFSAIEFTEDEIKEPVDGKAGLKRESVGCIQLLVQKSMNVQYTQVRATDYSAANSSSVKVWEQDKKIAGKLSMATRFDSL